MNLTAKTAAMVIGAVFVLVGLLGFVPNPLVSGGGLFVVDTMHNLVHIVSGIVILAAVYSGVSAALTLKVFGAVYGLVAVLGFLTGGDMLLGLIRVNPADHWLHLLLAVVILAAGFLLPDDKVATV